ncbi:hypothetical protein [Jiulongibacter sp. NS-SX5]|uniref:hypothetical protein n=1 Tax=Jiulongibacter sp. NS-SX5 TaxID=3463854 RepID=UPI0040587FAA
MSETVKAGLPNWALILIYLVIMAVLAIFGDLFIFILGAILETVVFAAGYNAAHADH